MLRRLTLILATQILLVTSAQAREKIDYLQLQNLREELRQIVSERDVEEQPFCRTAGNAGKDVSTEQRAIDDPDRKPNHESSSSGLKFTALDWVSTFALQQSLFAEEDVSALIESLTSMSNDDVDQWMVETTPLRAAMRTGEWQATNQWLSRFWEVQAFYDEEQEQEFRESLNSLTANELLVVMDHLSTLYFSRMSRLQRANLTRQNMPLLAPSRTTRATTSATAPAISSGPRKLPRRARRVPQRDLSLRVRNWYIFRGFLY